MAKTKWSLDPTHSDISFKIRHLMISHVSGTFKQFSIQVQTDGDDFSTATVNATLEAASINTNNDQRDQHLRAADFFEADKHPQFLFTSTKIEKVSSDRFIIHGDFTIKDTTKPVKFNVDYNGTNKDPRGNTKAGFSVHGKINRKDWGINYNAALETGGMLLGDELKVEAEIQLVKELVAQPA